MSALDTISATTNPSVGSVDRNKSTVYGKTAAETAEDKLSKDYDNFLLMLTTQLQNQDPTEPLDTNQMTAQLAQLSAVEQQISTNKNLEKLVSLYSSSQATSVVGYIGKEVEAPGGQAELKNGKAQFAYEIPGGADKVTVTVTNAAGQAVYSTSAPTGAGKNVFTWDGSNSFNGQQYNAGVFGFAVTAVDSKGTVLSGAKSYTVGKVDAVDTLPDKEPVLRIGNIRLPVSSVTSVGDSGPQSVVLAQ